MNSNKAHGNQKLKDKSKLQPLTYSSSSENVGSIKKMGKNQVKSTKSNTNIMGDPMGLGGNCEQRDFMQREEAYRRMNQELEKKSEDLISRIEKYNVISVINNLEALYSPKCEWLSFVFRNLKQSGPQTFCRLQGTLHTKVTISMMKSILIEIVDGTRTLRIIMIHGMQCEFVVSLFSILLALAGFANLT